MVHTEDDGFFHLADVPEDGFRDEVRAFVDNDVPLEVLDFVGILGQFSPNDRVSARDGELVDVQLDTLDFERGQESVVDACPEGVFIYRLTEIVIRIDVVVPLGGSRQSHVHRG